jgi:hypothetical protein
VTQPILAVWSRWGKRHSYLGIATRKQPCREGEGPTQAQNMHICSLTMLFLTGVTFLWPQGDLESQEVPARDWSRGFLVSAPTCGKCCYFGTRRKEPEASHSQTGFRGFRVETGRT